jgi:hypothetical protein
MNFEHSGKRADRTATSRALIGRARHDDPVQDGCLCLAKGLAMFIQRALLDGQGFINFERQCPIHKLAGLRRNLNCLATWPAVPEPVHPNLFFDVIDSHRSRNQGV